MWSRGVVLAVGFREVRGGKAWRKRGETAHVRGAEDDLYTVGLLTGFLGPLPQCKCAKVSTKSGHQLDAFDERTLPKHPLKRALGRKNYLFAGSHDGARWTAIYYTRIGRAKLHGVNPFDYLQDIMRRVHTHPASRVVELTPERQKENLQ